MLAQSSAVVMDDLIMEVSAPAPALPLTDIKVEDPTAEWPSVCEAPALPLTDIKVENPTAEWPSVCEAPALPLTDIQVLTL